MRKLIPARSALIIAAVALVAVGCTSKSTSGGQSASTPASPGATKSGVIDANGVNLEGTWTSTERQYYSLDTTGAGKETLRITNQQGPLFRVSRDIVLEQAYSLGNEGPPTISVTAQPALGIVNADGSITIVKKGDTGQLDGWLVDRDTMVLSYNEAGVEPAVARIKLVRAKAGSTSAP